MGLYWRNSKVAIYHYHSNGFLNQGSTNRQKGLLAEFRWMRWKELNGAWMELNGGLNAEVAWMDWMELNGAWMQLNEPECPCFLSWMRGEWSWMDKDPWMQLNGAEWNWIQPKTGGFGPECRVECLAEYTSEFSSHLNELSFLEGVNSALGLECTFLECSPKKSERIHPNLNAV